MRSFGLRHSNRSQTQQLDQRPPSGHIQQQQPQPPAGPAPASTSEDKGYNPNIQPKSYSDSHIGAEQQYHQAPIELPAAGSPYNRSEHSAAPESHRYSKPFQQQQQQQQKQQQQQQSQQHPRDFDVDQGSSNDLSQVPHIPAQLEKRHTLSVSNASNAPLEPPKKSKSRSFFGFTSKSQKDQQKTPPQPPQHHGLGIGRSFSKKQSSRPELRMQLNNSIEPLQQGWNQSKGSSSATLPSHAEQDTDDFDHQRREDEAEQHSGSRQSLRVRVVDDSQPQSQQYQHFQDEQHPKSPSQYSPQQLQQYQKFSQHTTPTSPDQNLEYGPQQMLSQQQPQYQPQNLNLASFGAHRQQNPEVVSQISRESPPDQTDDRPPSVNSMQSYPGQYPSRKASIAGPGSIPPQNLQQQGGMAPPQASGAQGHQGRKSSEVNKNLQPGDARGQPPGYSQGQSPPVQGPGQQPVNLQNPLPPIPGQPIPSGYRSNQLRAEFSAVPDGRSTPPAPDKGDSGLSEMDKLLVKYKKVKGLYFDQKAQVESLQNTLANQRLSQSKTSLDDSGYLTRFQRLDSAIKEIAFAIRKDWSSIPAWLSPVVNPDAMKTGTKEMTAVGRAVITRWLSDEVWGKCFHPGLEQPLREELKHIELQIRGYGPPPGTLEDQEAQTAKIVQWRLTTMEGLAWKLNSQTAQDAKADYVKECVSNMTAHLLQHLSEAAAMNIQGNATSIVELAVGISSHLPLESRDIVITYPTPKEIIQPWMKVEQALPPLEHYFSEPSEDGKSSKSKEEEEKSDKGGKKLKSKIFKAKEPQGPTPEQVQELERRKADAKERIRFAGFVYVEVKGRQSLYQPPVWTIL